MFGVQSEEASSSTESEEYADPVTQATQPISRSQHTRTGAPPPALDDLCTASPPRSKLKRPRQSETPKEELAPAKRRKTDPPLLESPLKPKRSRGSKVLQAEMAPTKSAKMKLPRTAKERPKPKQGLGANTSPFVDPAFRRCGHSFPDGVRRVLKEWYETHRDNPYPQLEHRIAISSETGLNDGQIRNWMERARRKDRDLAAQAKRPGTSGSESRSS